MTMEIISESNQSEASAEPSGGTWGPAFLLSHAGSVGSRQLHFLFCSFCSNDDSGSCHYSSSSPFLSSRLFDTLVANSLSQVTFN